MRHKAGQAGCCLDDWEENGTRAQGYGSTPKWHCIGWCNMGVTPPQPPRKLLAGRWGVL